jgi:hypothetical protein
VRGCRLSSVFVWLAAAATALSTAPAAAQSYRGQLEHRLAEFAQQIYYPVGSKRLTVIGDSINATNTPNRMSAGYRDAWHVPWNGWVVHADSGAADMGYLNSQNLGSGYAVVWDPGEVTGGGQIHISPVRMRESNYAKPPVPGTLLNDGMLLSSSTSRFPAGDLFTHSHVTARVLFYQGTNTLPYVNIRGVRGSITAVERTVYRATGPADRIVAHDLDLGVLSGSPRIQIYAAAGVPPTRVWDFWRVDVLGVVYRSSTPSGVQMSCISHGGWRTTDHVSPYKFSDKSLREYYAAIGAPTHMMLWLGQNQTNQEANDLVAGINTSYKNNLRAVMNRHEAAIAALGQPAPRWLLVSQFKTGYDPPVHELMAQTMYELSLENPRVSFLNLYELAGGQSFDNDAYTTDGIHPNLAGSVHLATLMDGLMRAAVRCPADLDASGFVDHDDLTLFLVLFEAGDAQADIDSSGFVDNDDRDAFNTAYEAGC